MIHRLESEGSELNGEERKISGEDTSPVLGRQVNSNGYFAQRNPTCDMPVSGVHPCRAPGRYREQ